MANKYTLSDPSLGTRLDRVRRCRIHRGCGDRSDGVDVVVFRLVVRVTGCSSDAVVSLMTNEGASVLIVLAVPALMALAAVLVW